MSQSMDRFSDRGEKHEYTHDNCQCCGGIFTIAALNENTLCHSCQEDKDEAEKESKERRDEEYQVAMEAKMDQLRDDRLTGDA